MYSSLTERLVKSPPSNTIALFKSAIYGFVLLNTVFLLPIAGDIWGSDSLIMPLEYPSTPLYHVYFLLMNDFATDAYPLIILTQIAAIAFWFLGKWRPVMSFLVYLTTAMLFTSAHLYTTGGHTLIKIFLFYLMLIPDQPRSDLGKATANLFLLACKVQIAVVYAFAAIFKLHGTYWVNGEALYYVLNIREFSHPNLQEILLAHPIVLKIGTWLGLGYQLFFPILVWFRATKKPLLLFGIFFHLFVAFGMGLPDFGIFMIISYTVFVRDQTAKNWRASLQSWPHAFQRGWKRG